MSESLRLYDNRLYNISFNALVVDSKGVKRIANIKIPKATLTNNLIISGLSNEVDLDITVENWHTICVETEEA